MLAGLSEGFYQKKYSFEYGRKAHINSCFTFWRTQSSTYKRSRNIQQQPKLLPQTSACDLFSQPNEESQIQDLIETIPERYFEALQPSQRDMEVKLFALNRKNPYQLTQLPDLKLENILEKRLVH